MRKGWYAIDGVQEGDRTLEQQIMGLEDLDVRGQSVLELGCAEGLMSRWLVEIKGAIHVTGLDVVDSHLAEARRQCMGLPIDIRLHDLNLYLPFGAHDTVLALAVLHKLHKPAICAASIAATARKQIVLRLPPATAPIVLDRRSGNTPHDCERPILVRGFKRMFVTEGPNAEWTCCYRR